MIHTIYQVDSFTREPFSGNPAGVCLLSEPADAAWMQAVAREMNLSETAFLVERKDAGEPSGRVFHLRWFTPVKEVQLCGHATLAAAHILWKSRTLPGGQQARFDTLSGRLTADCHDDWIEMNLPARFEQPTVPPEGLLQALGVQAEYVGKMDNNVYLVQVAREANIREMQPDFITLAHLPLRSVVVTARAETEGFDIISRYFAPAVGIYEDPATGSAHCILSPFWSARLGKTSLLAYQASARGGVLRLRLEGERVAISGQAVTVLEGTLFDTRCPSGS